MRINADPERERCWRSHKNQKYSRCRPHKNPKIFYVLPYLLIGLFGRKPRRPVLHDEALAGDHAGAAPALYLHLAAVAVAVAAVPPWPMHQLCYLPP